MTLLTETQEEFDDIGKSAVDVAFIGTASGAESCTWAQFEALADREYDSGYGGAEVRMDLVILFGDGTWLERSEYDGAEGWEYKRSPKPADSQSPLVRLWTRGVKPR